MSYSNSTANCTEIDDLDALAQAVREQLQASKTAGQNFVEHALAAGDALIRAKEQVKHGEWSGWLKKHCDLSERTAQRYMLLAENRAKLNPPRVADLSLSAAFKLIAKPQPDNSKPKKAKPATGFDALGWWTNASQKERSHFLESVGLKPLLAAIPPAWRQKAERETGPTSSRATTQIKLALSTNIDGEALAALAAVKRVLAAGSYDLHDVEIHLNNKNRGFGRAA